MNYHDHCAAEGLHLCGHPEMIPAVINPPLGGSRGQQMTHVCLTPSTWYLWGCAGHHHDIIMTQERLHRLTVASQNAKRVSLVVLLTESTSVQSVWGLLFVTAVARGHDGTVKRPVRTSHAKVSVSASASAARHVCSPQKTTACLRSFPHPHPLAPALVVHLVWDDMPFMCLMALLVWIPPLRQRNAAVYHERGFCSLIIHFVGSWRTWGNWMSTVFVTLMGNMCDCDRQELAVALHCFPQSPPERDIDRERDWGEGIMRERERWERKKELHF